MVTQKQVEDMDSAAGAVRALEDAHSRFVEVLRPAQAAPPGHGSIDVDANGNLQVTCLGQRFEVRRRFVSTSGWPDRVEYLFLVPELEGYSVRWAFYIDGNLNLSEDLARARPICDVMHARLKTALLATLGSVLINSDAFRPQSVGTRIP